MYYQYRNQYINQFFKELQNLKALKVPEVPKVLAYKNVNKKIENLEILEVPEVPDVIPI